MTVLATDQGVPNRVSSQQATVRINILRNLNCPVFNNLPANISISQSTGLGTRVYNVSATDLDTDVCSFLVSKSDMLELIINNQTSCNFLCCVWLYFETIWTTC